MSRRTRTSIFWNQDLGLAIEKDIVRQSSSSLRVLGGNTSVWDQAAVSENNEVLLHKVPSSVFCTT